MTMTGLLWSSWIVNQSKLITLNIILLSQNVCKKIIYSSYIDSIVIIWYRYYLLLRAKAKTFTTIIYYITTE